jgi:predicted dehydrogenase
MPSHLTRREFLRQAAACTVAAGALAGPALARPISPNDKLNLAIIGTGGRGHANMTAVARENIVALCDVDENALNSAAATFSSARKYFDFRKLLETEKQLDAVVVSTPDHCHAPVSVMAMNLGLHVYCEKPLTHSVYEARVMTETAARNKVVTQMGTGAQSAEDHIRTVEAIQAGVIGPVAEVHCWTNRPIWPQGQDRPAGEEPVPKHLHWDEWIGPAPVRPFKAKYADGPFKGQNVYHSFVWRGWWDFGTGALGDIAPHITNIAFWALDLGAPTSVEGECSGMKPETFPSWSILRFQFPARGQQPPVTLVWYDGGKRPTPEVLGGQRVGEGGVLFVGSKGRMLVGRPPIPAKDFAGFQWPKPTLPRRGEIHLDWIKCIKEGGQTGCRFEYSGPMTQAYLLGNIALKVGRKIDWDAAKFQVTNCPEANHYVKREYRPGWSL